MGRVAGRDRLDEALFVVWTYCDQDFVRDELGKGVTKCEVDVGLPRQSLNCFAWECVSSRLGNTLRVAKGSFVVGKPVEHALTHYRHHDSYLVPASHVRPQLVLRVLDRADNQDAWHNTGPSRPAGDSIPESPRQEAASNAAPSHRAHPREAGRGTPPPHDGHGHGGLVAGAALRTPDSSSSRARAHTREGDDRFEGTP